MIGAQKTVADYCGRLREAVQGAELPETITGRIAPLAEEARERELVVPVIGAFSAGKSSMINTLIGRESLPVAITPETSLATELRYSPEEYIEAVQPDGKTNRYGAGDMKKLSADADRYSYARLFLNNPRLKELEPLALVDMPGFDSPLDAHNKAIMAYLDRGCHYIVLSSVEEGALTKSLIRRLREIDAFGRGFSFFLTKSDLRPSETVAELTSHYGDNLRDQFDYPGKVIPLNNKSADAVVNLLKGIDANAIFLGMYRERFSDLCDDCIEALNLKIKASGADARKIEEAAHAMRDSIEKLKKKAAEDMETMRRRYSGSMTGDVISDVGKALESSVDELVSAAASGRQEEVSRRINEVTQSALTVSVKSRVGEMNRRIVMDFSESLKGLDKVMKDLDLNANYLVDMTAKIASSFTSLPPLNLPGGPGGSPILNVLKNPALGQVSQIGGLSLILINPILGIVVSLLPSLLGLLFSIGGTGRQEQQKQALRSKFLGEVFPAIKSKLRAEIPAHLEEQAGVMIDAVRTQYEERIKAQEAELQKAAEAQAADQETIKARTERLEDARSKVQAIASEIRSWGN